MEYSLEEIKKARAKCYPATGAETDWLIAEVERLDSLVATLREDCRHTEEHAQSSLTRSKAEGRREAFEEAAKLVEARGCEVKGAVNPKITAAAIRQQAGHPAEEKPEIPAIIFDGAAVYEALDHHGKRRTSPEAVGDVLDAIARLMKK